MKSQDRFWFEVVSTGKLSLRTPCSHFWNTRVLKKSQSAGPMAGNAPYSAATAKGIVKNDAIIRILWITSSVGPIRSSRWFFIHHPMVLVLSSVFVAWIFYSWGPKSSKHLAWFTLWETTMAVSKLLPWSEMCSHWKELPCQTGWFLSAVHSISSCSLDLHILEVFEFEWSQVLIHL